MCDGKRTGVGRRARDRLLVGEVRPLPRTVPAPRRPELQNLMLFLSDELRESALAVAGIEAYLVRARTVLDQDTPDIGALAELLDEDELERRLRALDDNVGSLRRSIIRLYDQLR